MSLSKEQEINAFLRHTIAKLTEDPALEQLLKDDQLIQGAGMDSIRIINMIVQIELNYDIAFDDEELQIENFATLKVIGEQIMHKLGVIK
ncbi:phosphopantetheine-binding protein [Cohnella mopanensis]|uniref:phosphopantetheine-binding protein n=1 Tax=Cohnella mopanensis TaxID=2911966 RepID=UPI001EF8342A|nr:phosphopantetheine-binding protein [Cohnella mopanensis]